MTGTRGSWPWRVLRWPLSVLLIVATVVAGSALLRNRPGSQEMSRPFIHSGPMGAGIDGLTFVGTVTSVRGGLALTEGDDEYTTGGVFVLVSVQLSALKAPTTLQYVAVVDRRGRVFEASQRFIQGLRGYLLQPNLTVQGEIMFEVPREAAAGLIVQLSSDTWGRQNLNQTVIQVDLGIDQATVTRWVDTRQPLDYAPARVTA